MKLPDLPYKLAQKQSEIVAIRGINYSDNYKDGALAESENISVRRFPYFTTRRARKKLEEYKNVDAITAWGKLVVIESGEESDELYYDGESVAKLEKLPQDKKNIQRQFAVVNTRLVIWPDKVYFDILTKEIKTLGAKLTVSGVEFKEDRIVFPSGTDLSCFSKGDGIHITGCAEKNNDKNAVIRGIEENQLIFVSEVETSEEDDETVAAPIFTPAKETGEVIFERRIPDLDFICESENRLWGCSNSECCIYASSLGDPTNFFVNDGVSTDSYTLAIGSEGDFTGCCKLSSSVLFFKHNALHKILGSYPAEYAMYSYTIEGVAPGCYESMQVINETLYYMSEHGVFAYSGGNTSFVSSALGSREYKRAVAGTDGDNYYLSAQEGDEWHLFVLNLKTWIWIKEDNVQVKDFARIGKELYFLTSDGEVFLADSLKEDNEVKWFMQFKPFFETIEGKKRYSRLMIRVELPKGSWLKAQVRCDGGLWKETGIITGDMTGTKTMTLAINRCDKFEVRLSGKGQCTILNLLRIFSIGGAY
jgi:hypothetical protein